jgi:tripartite-type tricarboxylate transporter receptor subunit TctC
VPYTPGGITDVVTRIVGERLSAALGQPVVIENKPGANSILGADSVAKSPPDGYTFVMVIGAHAANATLYAGKLPFDPVGSFVPVSLVGVAPLVMAGSPKLPARSVAELVAYAKANPGRVNFGSSGVGAAAHLTTEYLKRRAGIDMVHVPYRGSAPALTGLMAGDIGVLVDTYSTSSRRSRRAPSGRWPSRARAAARTPPTSRPSRRAGSRTSRRAPGPCCWRPRARPPDIVSRVSAEIARAVRDPAVAGRFADLGVEPAGGTPAEAEAFLKAEVEKWGGIIREAGVKLDP